MQPGDASFADDGLYFREWRDSDTQQLSRLFDTDEMNRWTPLPSPFPPEAAVEYVIRAREARDRDGTLQLAVCAEPGALPIAEVVVFPTDEPETVELAYAVGADHRGNRIGSRSVLAALRMVRRRGIRRAILTIASDNAASQATARAAGFVLTAAPLRRRERKGFVLDMQTWEKRL